MAFRGGKRYNAPMQNESMPKTEKHCGAGKVAHFLYRIILFFIRLFYPKIEIEGLENIPEGGAILIGNHAQMDGPLSCRLYLPENTYIWCAGEMMYAREVPGYAFMDFWSFKPKWTHWFFRLLSFLITPLAVILFNNAGCIEVRRDNRVMQTFRETAQRFAEGANVVIFPEENKPCNAIVYDFQDGFPAVAGLCGKMSGRPVPFVPMYLAPKLRKLVIGEPIWYNEKAPRKEERERLRVSLRDAVTELGRSLPGHTVVPYRNIAKKDYPRSTDMEWPTAAIADGSQAEAKSPEVNPAGAGNAVEVSPEASPNTDKESPTT